MRADHPETNGRDHEGRDRRCAALFELFDRLGDEGDATELSRAAADIMGRALGLERAGYVTVSGDGAPLPGDAPGDGPDRGAGPTRDATLDRAIAGMAQGAAFAVDDLRADARAAPARAVFERHEVRALIHQPVMEDGRLVAFFYALDAAPRAWAAAEVDFVRAMARHTRAAIERRRAEERLRALNAQLEERIEERSAELQLFRKIVQSDVKPVCAFDRDFRVLAFNRALQDEFFRVYGHRVQAGDVFPDLFLPEQAAAIRGFLARALAGESFTVIEAFGHPDIAVPVWEISYNPLRSDRGDIIGVTQHGIDVSRRIAQQAELADVQEALRQAQKLEAVGQLTGGVAHDFNNLLTVIKSATDLLRRPGLAEARRAHCVGAISDTVDRAARLTGQLLAFARRQSLQPKVFAVSDSIRAMSDMVATLSGPRIEIVTRLPDAPCFVRADPSQFDTALVNMAVNARDAMNGEGRLTIGVDIASRPAALAAPAADGGEECVAVAVVDTGCGIPAAQIDRIFEPFFTTKGVGRGTGLGLSQVYGFARQSGGEVMVESRVGEGTRFVLYLPRVPAPAPAAPAADAAPPADGRGMRVLVVEDHPGVGGFAVQTLSALGHLPVLATSGPQALDAIGRCGEGFDVVFADVVLPGMSGIELGREIRRRHAGLPVLLTSGHGNALAQEGDDGFELLQKPYSVDQLARLLREAAAAQPVRLPGGRDGAERASSMEGVGFEPTEDSRPRQFSRLVP